MSFPTEMFEPRSEKQRMCHLEVHTSVLALTLLQVSIFSALTQKADFKDEGLRDINNLGANSAPVFNFQRCDVKI